MAKAQIDLTQTFRDAMSGPYGLRRTAIMIREIVSVLADAQAEGITWIELAQKMTTVFEEVGRSPISAATLRGVYGREKRKRHSRLEGRPKTDNGIAKLDPKSAPVLAEHHPSPDLTSSRPNVTPAAFTDGERASNALMAIRGRK